jgi:hypothetical protein
MARALFHFGGLYPGDAKETLHNAGKHQESVDTLAKAMAILGIDQG